MLELGRDVCGELRFSGEREWLVTNGIGGYASGTVAGVLARSYHGLLIAALQPPVGRTLLLTKLDETVIYDGISYPLFANRWAGGEVEPTGFQLLERFRLEGTTPVWTFACADALLEKRVWMQPGHNTTYVRYVHLRGSSPIAMSIKAIVNHRDHHGRTRATAWPTPMRIDSLPQGLQVTATDHSEPLYLLSDRARATPRREWYQGYYLSVEDYRGQKPNDDNLNAGRFQATLRPGESLTIVASTSADPDLDGDSAYAERRAHEKHLIEAASTTSTGPGDAPEPERALPQDSDSIEHLVLAADQFIVRRTTDGDLEGRSIIAGYPWFSDWGRDTMISLPGLTLTTGRHDVAAKILRTFAHYADRGMLPNRFPDAGEEPEYNTVDATLWYFEAIRAYYGATGDKDLLQDLFPVLQDIVEWHQRGTRYRIHLDPADGLLYAGENGVQLTWMDAKIDGWVVTPRIGKPVEVNALWYHALRCMAQFAHRLGETARPYDSLAEQALAGFARFWNPFTGYCYDVLDGPDGNNPALRPNQLFAVSLAHSPLSEKRQRAIVDICARHLLTSHGLRSLAPGHPDYVGDYGGDRRQRDAAYHQGTVWGWLIGPFASAHLRVHGDPGLARSFLRPLLQHLTSHGVGSLSEIFDGDAPFTPRGCFAQAWTVAEVLRAWQATTSPRSTGRVI
jgi:predicted glycogen debranching enzyme